MGKEKIIQLFKGDELLEIEPHDYRIISEMEKVPIEEIIEILGGKNKMWKLRGVTGEKVRSLAMKIGNKNRIDDIIGILKKWEIEEQATLLYSEFDLFDELEHLAITSGIEIYPEILRQSTPSYIRKFVKNNNSNVLNLARELMEAQNKNLDIEWERKMMFIKAKYVSDELLIMLLEMVGNKEMSQKNMISFYNILNNQMNRILPPTVEIGGENQQIQVFRIGGKDIEL